jgi:hypothetical protein
MFGFTFRTAGVRNGIVVAGDATATRLCFSAAV